MKKLREVSQIFHVPSDVHPVSKWLVDQCIKSMNIFVLFVFAYFLTLMNLKEISELTKLMYSTYYWSISHRQRTNIWYLFSAADFAVWFFNAANIAVLSYFTLKILLYNWYPVWYWYCGGQLNLFNLLLLLNWCTCKATYSPAGYCICSSFKAWKWTR